MSSGKRRGERSGAATAKGERCPVCSATVGAAPQNRTYPFCSERCRTIDLGNWLDGRYRVAGPPADVLGDDDAEDHGPH